MMKRERSLSGLAVFSLLSFPAMSSQGLAQSNDICLQGIHSEDISSEEFARHIASKVSKGIKDSEARLAGFLESIHGARQFVLGAYPIQPQVVKSTALGSKTPLQEAKDLNALSLMQQGLWVSSKSGNSDAPRAKGIHILKDKDLVIEVVAYDPLVRALELNLIKLDGNSPLSVSNPFVDKPPYQSPNNSGAAAMTIVDHAPSHTREETFKLVDHSSMSRPEFVRGPLKSLNLSANEAGPDSNSGLLDIGGVVSLDWKETDIRWEYDKNHDLYRLWLLHKEGKSPIKIPESKIPKRRIVYVFEGSEGQSVQRIFCFYGPTGMTELAGNQKLRQFIQRQIESSHRDLLQTSLAEIFRAEALEDSVVNQENMMLLARDKLARIALDSGSGSSTMPLLSVLEIQEYLKRATFGLNDNSAKDLRYYLLMRYQGASAEVRKEYWKTQIANFDKNLAALRKERENAISAGELVLQEHEGVDYPWRKFTDVSLVASDVIPGMLYARFKK